MTLQIKTIEFSKMVTVWMERLGRYKSIMEQVLKHLDLIWRVREKEYWMREKDKRMVPRFPTQVTE